MSINKKYVFAAIWLAAFMFFLMGDDANGVIVLPPSYIQYQYRWRNDDGSESAATWKAAVNTEVTNQAKQQNVRLRFEIVNDPDANGGGTDDFNTNWQYSTDAGGNCTAGTWTAIPVTPTTQHWELVSSSNFADTDATTNNGFSTHGGSTFVAGKMREEPVSGGSYNVTLSPAYYTHVEEVFQATTNATDGGTYYIRVTRTGSSLLNSYFQCAKITLETPVTASPALSQAAYRWFTNTNSTSVGASAPINTAIVATTTDNQLRLRLLLHVADATLSQSGTTTKMQYAERSGTCDTAFSGESFTDITTSSAILYLNNSTPADNTALTAHVQDPRHASSTGTGASDTVVDQTYNDGDVDNTFTNSVAAILAGQDGLWDFSLTFATVKPGTAYCLRAVQNGGGQLGSYSVVPELSTAGTLHVRLRGQIRLRVVRLR